MYNVILIEDDFMSLELMEAMLKENFEELQVVAKATTIKQGVEKIKSHQPDLIFLDIHLPDGDGFEILRLTSDEKYDVIFTTAYNQYALKAFEYMALHYLLKPINIKELQKGVQRFLKKERNIKTKEHNSQITKGIRNNDFKRIAIPSHNEVIFVELKDVIYLEAQRGYTQFIMLSGNAPLMSSKSLGYYEKILTDTHFFRIHDKHMININQIKKYIKGKGGTVELMNGKQLAVSVRRKNDFMDKMSVFLNNF